jgi:hypothetical protein
MNNSIVPLIKELERIYDSLADKFNLKSDRPIITIQSKGKQKILGWFWQEKWTKGETNVGEINICAEALNKNPVETLVHEMVHHANHIDNIKDCNGHGYHNKNFKERAELYGLNVNKDGRHGWSCTSIAPKLDSILKDIKIDYKVFELYRKENITIKAPTKMIKYICKCTTIRCATSLKAKCLVCNEEFKESD